MVMYELFSFEKLVENGRCEGDRLGEKCYQKCRGYVLPGHRLIFDIFMGPRSHRRACGQTDPLGILASSCHHFSLSIFADAICFVSFMNVLVLRTAWS